MKKNHTIDNKNDFTSFQTTVFLTVPEPVRQWILRRRIAFEFIFLLILGALTYFQLTPFRPAHLIFVAPPLALAIISVIKTLVQLKGCWRYEISVNSFRLFHRALFGSLWILGSFQKREETEILQIKQETWRQFPALRVETGKDWKDKATFWLVYDESDSARVQNEVLPLLKLYGAELTLTEEKKPYCSK